MKAIVFTTDAIFSLLIAGAAIAILLYFIYLPQVPYIISYASTQYLVNELTSIHVGSMAPSSPTANEMVAASKAAGTTWTETGGSFPNSPNFSSYGPTEPSIDYINYIWPPQVPTSEIVADSHNYYYLSATGQGDPSSVQVVAENITTGKQLWVWTDPTWFAGPGGSLALYQNEVLMKDTGGTVFALNTRNGSLMWYINNGEYGSPPLILDGNKVMQGNGDSFDAYYATNGVLAWSNSLNIGSYSFFLGYPHLSSFVTVGGLVALEFPWNAGWFPAYPENIMIISPNNGLLLNVITPPGGMANGINTTITAVNSNMIAFGVNEITYSNVCAYYINGTESFCNPIYGYPQSIAGNGNSIFYQTNTGNVIAYSTTGTLEWETQLPLYGGSYGFYGSSADMVVSPTLLYTRDLSWIDGESSILALNVSTGQVVWSQWIPPLSFGAGGFAASWGMALSGGRLFIDALGFMAVLGPCNGSPSSSVLDTAIQLYLQGDGSCAQSLLNSVQNTANYSISLNGGTSQDAYPINRVATFNGIGYVAIENSTSNSNYNTGLTFSAWFNLSQTKSGVTQGIMSQGENWGSGWLGDAPFAAMYVTGNQLFCAVRTDLTGSSTATLVVNSLQILKPDTWYQSAVTYNTTTAAMGCYLDGSLVSNTIGSIYNFVEPFEMFLGSYWTYTYGTQSINGSIGNVQVYNSMITSSQAAALYNYGMLGGPLKSAGLIGWYPLLGDTNDYSGQYNTGFLDQGGFGYSDYVPASLNSAYQISKSEVLLPIPQPSYLDFSGTGASGALLPSNYISLNPYFTVSFWFNMSNTLTTEASNDATLVSTDGCGFDFSLASSGSGPTLDASSSSPCSSTVVSVPSNFIKDQWNNVVMTTSPSGVKLYINGVASGSGSWSVTPSFTSICVAMYCGYGSTGSFAGSIADLQLYNLTFTAYQALQQYQGGPDGLPYSQHAADIGLTYTTPTGPVLDGWWPLNSNANDSSGLLDSGTVYNAIFLTPNTFYNVGIYSWR